MKKLAALLTICLLLLLAGCSEMHNAIYDDDAKLAANSDNYAATLSVGNKKDGVYTQSATMTGVETLWTYDAPEDCEVVITYRLSVTQGGKAKLVLVGPDDSVATIVENADNTVTDEERSQVFSLQKGKNRIRIVGYDSPKYELSVAVTG